MDKKPFKKPTPEQLQAAWGKEIKDIIAPDLDVLFCGYNPGLYSGAVGCHFTRPGNRIWQALYRAGFTPRQLQAWEQKELLKYGCGLTNLAGRATAAAADLNDEELVEGRMRLARKARRYTPRYVALLGIGAYRTVFQVKKVSIGEQPGTFGGAKLWVLPNPSGLNAHYPPDRLADEFTKLRKAVSH